MGRFSVIFCTPCVWTTLQRFRYISLVWTAPNSKKNIFWGSFFDFGFTCSGYYGIDINPKIVDIANKKYPDEIFRVEDISKLKPTTRAFDVAISSGVAGNRQGPADTPDKLMHYLNFMFNTANTVIVNFPSNRANIRSKGVEYFSPEYIVSQALILTNNIQLIHKNQSDFLLILKHNE